ncbi:hypothetical protein [Kitasatospora sp. NPDC093806]|uniref:hypothetical protein n=1 Tax=Kitasatospora sp. NPDC093806 TaxID=3155075 RepID=UPI00341914D0
MAGIVGVVALPAANAFADTPSGPPAAPPSADPHPWPTGSATPTVPGPAGNGHKLKTQELLDGYVADVTEEKGTYTAEIRIALSGPLLTLKVDKGAAPVTGKHNGHTFILSGDGKVTATKDKAPDVARRPAGSQELIDGYIADVFKVASAAGVEKGYEADIRIALSGSLLTLKVDKGAKPVTGKHNGHTFTLSGDGKVTATKDAGDQPGTPKPTSPSGGQQPTGQPGGGAPSNGQSSDGGKPANQAPAGEQPKGQPAGGAPSNGQSSDGGRPASQASAGEKSKGQTSLPVVPKGAVKAGAESVDAGTGVLAAGVGLAGAGAAGLALVLRRRGQA